MIPSAPRKRSTFAFTMAAAVLAAACSDGMADSAGGAEMDQAGGTDAQVMIDNLLVQEATVRQKIEGLAQAMPEEMYDWRPMEGVRSVGEVFIHVAADNYLLPGILGVEAPAGTGIAADDYATVQAYEAREMSKEEVLAALAESFDHMEAAVATTRTDMDHTATAFGTEFTTGGLWTMAVTHLHEHLGQSIAYARSNGVAPPWSR